MRPPRLEPPASWALLLFTLTAGFGLCTPPVRGLGGCEFQFHRLLWAAVAWLTVVPFVATVCAVAERRRFARGLFVVWPLAVIINVGLDQDPLCAAINWYVQAVHLEESEDYRHWGLVTSIANHEHIGFDERSGEFYVQRGA